MPDIALDSATRTLLTNTNTDVRSTAKQANKEVTSEEEVKLAVVETSDEKEELPAPEESTREAVDKLQTYADQLKRDLEFSVDDSSGRTVVTVRDGSTDEVIRQIPSEEALRLAGEIDTGGVSLFDARA